MPESRDRLHRHGDVLATFSTRNNIGRSNPVNIILQDEGSATGTPFRWRGVLLAGSPGPVGVTSTRGSFGTPRIARDIRGRGPSTPITGQENPSPFWANGRGRGHQVSVLPSWYPRLPLRDISAVVRAIERRALREESEGLVNVSPILEDQTVQDPSMPTPDAQLEHDSLTTSSEPTNRTRHSLPSIDKVPKILLDITNQNDGDSWFLTPEKKLLNNIDSVEKVVMEELGKLKKTPTAKKVEREKRVRTLMSMR